MEHARLGSSVTQLPCAVVLATPRTLISAIREAMLTGSHRPPRAHRRVTGVGVGATLCDTQPDVPLA